MGGTSLRMLRYSPQLLRVDRSSHAAFTWTRVAGYCMQDTCFRTADCGGVGFWVNEVFRGKRTCDAHFLFVSKQDAATPTLKSVVALLKLGDWDPDVFYKFRDIILNQVYMHQAKVFMMECLRKSPLSRPVFFQSLRRASYSCYFSSLSSLWE